MSNNEVPHYSEWFQHRSCGRKRRYTTYAEAARGRRWLSERLRIYGPCEFCGGFHIGGLDTDDYDKRPIDPKTGFRLDEDRNKFKRRKGKPGRSKRDPR